LAEIVELRVHGVGGTPAEALLGVESQADLIQVGGDPAAPFQARRADPLVEGYVWGKLTSKGLLQPLWLLLLPFTLVNVAGWMHPPDDDYRTKRLPILPLLRFLVWALGLLLTVAYVLWLANIVVNRILAVETVFGWTPAREIKVLMSLGVLLALVGLQWLIARHVQRGFEGFPGPGRCGDEERGRPSVLVQAGRLVAPEAEGLGKCRFWFREREAGILLTAHALSGVATVIFVGVWAVTRADPRFLETAASRADPTKASLQLGALATGATEILLWILVALGVAQLIGWRIRPRAEEPRFRFLGPMTTAGLGVEAGTGFVYGLTVLVLGDPGRIGALGMAFGMAVLAGVLGLGVAAVWLWRGARRAVREAKDPGHPGHVPLDPQYEGGSGGDLHRGRELEGATPAMYERLGWARSGSDAGRNMDLVVFFVQMVFLVVALWELRGGLRLEEVPYLGGLATLGHLLALSAAGGILVFLVRRAYRPSQRRLIGILWDVLTFWPRRFHPLGVRPYAERAVPELQHRLVHHADELHRMVILSAHSQGTVIAYAALMQGDHVFDRVARRVALLTYGSPLWQLHAMAFPAYFDRRGFERLRKRLYGGAAARSPAWRNFYRRTDYIGKEVFGNHLDEEVDDPARVPTAVNQPKQAWPDPPRSPWVDLARHSFYNSEEKLKKHVETLRKEMSQARAPRRGARVGSRSAGPGNRRRAR
jgi:hypothetical protein